MFKNEWLSKGPALSEIVSQMSDGRKGKNETLIIMPSFKGKAKLEKHTEYLKNQNYRNFDLAIIYGPQDEFIHDVSGISIVHIKRNGDYGSAGGFYTGERFAIEQGYKYVIMADDDCYPVDKTVLGAIVEKLTHEDVLVFPTAYVGTMDFMNHLLGFYAGLRVSTLKKAGLSWMPFYYYGEDTEWHIRLSKYVKNSFLPNKVVHETRQAYFFSDRSYYTVRNCLLHEFMARHNFLFIKFSSIFIFSAMSFFIFDTPRATYLFEGVSDFVRGKLFRANPSANFNFSGAELPKDAMEAGYNKRQERASALRMLFSFANKKVFTEKANFTGLWIILVYFLSKEFCVVDEKKKVLYKSSAPTVKKILWLLLLPLIISGSIAGSFAALAIAYLTLPYNTTKNFGYGVPEK